MTPGLAHHFQTCRDAFDDIHVRYVRLLEGILGCLFTHVQHLEVQADHRVLVPWAVIGEHGLIQPGPNVDKGQGNLEWQYSSIRCSVYIIGVLFKVSKRSSAVVDGVSER